MTNTPRIRKRLLQALGLLILVYSIFAQVGMKMRVSDVEAIQRYAAEGVQLHFNNLKVDGTALHYAYTGPDTLPTLVFIHGSPGSWDAFGNFLKDSILRSHFRIVSIDRPGFGYSEFGHSQSLPRQSELIGALIKHLHNDKPFHIVGHSLGGPIAVWIAQHHPSLISSAVILAGSISPIHEPVENWRKPFASFPLMYLVPGALRTSNYEILSFKQDLLLLDTGYQQITAAITFIHGEKDQLVPVENAYYGMDKMAGYPKADTIILKGEGHFIPWTQFELIRDHLLSEEPIFHE